jgi:hypothetical protein
VITKDLISVFTVTGGYRGEFPSLGARGPIKRVGLTCQLAVAPFKARRLCAGISG